MKRFFFLLLGMVLSTPIWASAPSCNLLVAKASDLSFIVELDKNDPAGFLTTSYMNLEIQGQLEESSEIIKRIATEGVQSISAVDRATLKNTRKYTAIVRSAWHIAHQAHEAPKIFEDLVKEFGKLNDYIAEGLESAAQRQARVVNGIIEDYRTISLIDDMTPSKRAAIYNYFKALKSEIQSLLEPEKISIKNYHEVRKSLKEFVTYYLLRSQLTGASSGDVHQYLYLNALNDSLGALNDQLTAQVIAGTLDKKRSKIKIPTQLLRQIEFFIKNSRV